MSVNFLPVQKKGGNERVNTALRQAQREVCRLKSLDSIYGMTEISIFIDFSRRPEESENLTGYQQYLTALAENDNDIAKAIEASGLSRDSIVTEPMIEEPFLLCRTKVTKLQEQFLLNR